MREVELMQLSTKNCMVSSYFSRRIICSGGGVLILTTMNLRCINITIPIVQSMLVEKELECCLSEIFIDGFTFVLACVYRSR